MNNDNIIQFNSSDAATYGMFFGWVDRHGRFFGKDERTARWSGCTHRPCEQCGEQVEKRWTHCAKCQEERAAERYANYPRKEWDGKTPLYSESAEKYFFDAGELDDFLFETETNKDDARLVLCYPLFLRYVETEYWEDVLLEDCDPEECFPEDVLDALNYLNYVIGENKDPVSWCPDKIAAVLPGDKKVES